VAWPKVIVAFIVGIYKEAVRKNKYLHEYVWVNHKGAIKIPRLKYQGTYVQQKHHKSKSHVLGHALKVDQAVEDREYC